MNMPHGSQLQRTSDNPKMCQVDDKTAKPVRVRSGEGTVAYWRNRLFRNTYRDRDGKTVEIPEFYVRMRHGGMTRRVRLHNSDKDKAAEEALRLAGMLEAEGWTAVTARQARLPASPSIEEFCGLYRKAASSMERPPRNVTISLYCRCLRQVCAYAGVKQIRELDRNAVERARDAYRARARKEKRPESAIQNTLSKVLRNAAACFSRESRAIFARSGLSIENPFDGVKRSQDIQPVSPLPRGSTERIWQEAPLLRDGDPHATDPARTQVKKEKKWAGRTFIDFRQPHPDAYGALLLALGCGLRANEIDKARWTWLKTSTKGDYFIEVGEESDFQPKGGSSRIIKIPQDLHEALVETRRDLRCPYILGGRPTAEVSESAEKSESYRSPMTFRIVNAWLRARGIEAGKKFGNPLHRLRKQFGSELATEFGLFAAQKLLGHSSPTVTAKYYAAQTELPTLTHVRIVG